MQPRVHLYFLEATCLAVAWNGSYNGVVIRCPGEPVVMGKALKGMLAVARTRRVEEDTAVGRSPREHDAYYNSALSG